MGFYFLDKCIFPDPGVTDCPILLLPNEMLRSSILANRRSGERINLYAVNGEGPTMKAMGSFACNRCIHQCNTARPVVSETQLEEWRRTQPCDIFDYQETPVTVGERLVPQERQLVLSENGLPATTVNEMLSEIDKFADHTFEIKVPDN